MMTEDDEPMADVPEEESGESSNRMFVILAAGLGGLFVVGLICIGAVFFYQQNQQASQRAIAIAQSTKNAATIATATAAAISTETPAPTQPPPATEPPAPTNTPTVVNTPTLTETPLPTVPAATGKPAQTTTPAKTPAGTAAAASSELTPTPVGSTPSTGIGGLGLVLVAGVLVIALFAARGLRLAQRQR